MKRGGKERLIRRSQHSGCLSVARYPAWACVAVPTRVADSTPCGHQGGDTGHCAGVTAPGSQTPPSNTSGVRGGSGLRELEFYTVSRSRAPQHLSPQCLPCSAASSASSRYQKQGSVLCWWHEGNKKQLLSTEWTGADARSLPPAQHVYGYNQDLHLRCEL